MTGVTPPIYHLNAGEISPKLSGRADLSWYGRACHLLENAIPRAQGPAERRPGTLHLGFVDGLARPRLLRFEANVDAAYIVEATDEQFRFWTDLALVQVGGVPVELVTPYSAAQLAELRTTQSADVMWLFHKDVAPQVLRRLTATSFELVPFEFVDGPYQAVNITATTLTPAATTGSGIALEASADLFAATDVGRLVRIKHTVDNPDPEPDEVVWGWAVIASFVDAQNVTIDIKGDFGGTTASVDWRLGLFSETTGWPSCATIHGERLVLGSNIGGGFPRIDGSVPGDFSTFRPGTNDDDAFAFVIGANGRCIIRDLVSMRTLLVLTDTVEFSIGGEAVAEPLTPSNIGQSLPFSREGAANVPAVAAKNGTLFVQRTGKALIELARTLEADGLRSTDLSVRAEHLLDESPLRELAWANRPFNVVWAIREDGLLVGQTYQPDQQVYGWSRQPIGGGGFVESMAVLPAPDGDELWLAVRRGSGAPIAMEVMRFPLTAAEHPAKAYHVDGGLVLGPTDETVALSLGIVAGAWCASTAVDFFGPGHVGRELTGFWIDGREKDGQPRWRQIEARVATLSDARRVILESPSGATPAATLNAGDWRWKVTTLAGLSHLNGVAVSILADGAPVIGKVVDGGQVELDTPAGFVAIGRPFRTRIWPTRPEGGSTLGTNIGKPQRVRNVAVRLTRSGACHVGIVNGMMQEAPTRVGRDTLGRAPPLQSRDVRVPLSSSTDDSSYVAIEGELPTPLIVNCIVPALDVGDTG